ncbi:MAG: hypothetical protein FWC16_08815 [Defluviitaleaceae bacterium]|nr:hypothetical protein [Defluviitaleaceae bacterium]MCL2275012.1 hypothetical protein [Defluviitaleaceae bacterium]
MTVALPLRENPDIMKFIESMKSTKLKPQQQGFIALLEYTDAITHQYNAILDELYDLKERIGGITDKKSPLVILADKLDTLTADVGTKLSNLKDSIVSFTKNALDAVKEKGLSALNSMFSVLHVKDGLQAMSKACAKSVEALDKAVARCDSLEKHCHEKTAAQPITHASAEPLETSAPPTLSDLIGDTRLDFENLSPTELQAVYAKFLAIGMNNNLTASENVCLQSFTEDVEALLPEHADTAHTQEIEHEAEEGAVL